MNDEIQRHLCEELTTSITKLVPLSNLFNLNESNCDGAENVLTREIHRVVKDYPPKRQYITGGRMRVFVVRKAVISKPLITETTGDVRTLTPTECKQRICSLLGSIYIWYDEWEWSPQHPFSVTTNMTPSIHKNVPHAKRLKLNFSSPEQVRNEHAASATGISTYVPVNNNSDTTKHDWTLTRPYKCKLYEGYNICELSAREQEAFPFLVRFEHHPRHKLTDFPIPVGSIACHSYHDNLSSTHHMSSAQDGTFIIRGSAYASLKTSEVKRNYAFMDLKEKKITMHFRKDIRAQTRSVMLKLVHMDKKKSNMDALVWKLPYMDTSEHVPWYLVFVSLICVNLDDCPERTSASLISMITALLENYLEDRGRLAPCDIIQMREFLTEQIVHAKLACNTSSLARADALIYIGQRTYIEKERHRAFASATARPNGLTIDTTELRLQREGGTSATAENESQSHTPKLAATQRNDELMHLGQSAISEMFSHLGTDKHSESTKLAHLCDMTARLLLGVRGYVREDDSTLMCHRRFRTSYDFLPRLIEHHMKDHFKLAYQTKQQDSDTAAHSREVHKKLVHTSMSKRVEGAFLFNSSDKYGYERDAMPRLEPLDPINASVVLSMQRMTVAVDTHKHSTDLRSRELRDDIGLCPVETPISDACGLKRPMSLFGRMSMQGVSIVAFTDYIIHTFGLTRTAHIFHTSNCLEFADRLRTLPVRIHVNGHWVANCTVSDAAQVAIQIRRSRYAMFARTFVSVHEATASRQLNIWVDSGRIAIPLINLARLNQLLTQNVSTTDDRKVWMALSWDMIIAENYIDMIDAEELPNIIVAADPRDLIQRGDSEKNPHGVRFTHMDILPIARFGATAAQSVFMPHSKPSRHIIECAQRGIGPRLFNHLSEFNKLVRVMEYPSKPLVFSMAIDLLKIGATPTGRSVSIAITDFGQQSYADAMCMDQAIIDRGFARETQYHTITVCEKKNGTRVVQTIQSRDSSNAYASAGISLIAGQSKNTGEVNDGLDVDGFARVGTRVERHEGGILVGCTQHISTGIQKCNDVLATTAVSGIIHRCLVTTTKDGLRMGKVTVRKTCKPCPGNKFNVRPGIKGVLAKTYQRQDMVFTTDGHAIELLINYTTLLNRGTLGPVLEMLLGTAAVNEFYCGDGTSFLKEAFHKYISSAEKHATTIAASGLANGNVNFEEMAAHDAFATVQRALKRQGLSDNGSQALISGRTGRQLGETQDGVGRVFCFGKGTQVLMGDGSQCFIETIRINDSVMGGHGEAVLVADVVSGSDILYTIDIVPSQTCCLLLPSSHMDAYAVTAHHILVLKCDTTPRLEALPDSVYCVHTYALKTFPSGDIFTPRVVLFTEETATEFTWTDYDTEDAMMDDIADFIHAQSHSVLWEVSVHNFLAWEKTATTSRMNLRHRVHACWSANSLVPVGITRSSVRSSLHIFDAAEMTQFINFLRMKYNVWRLPSGITSIELTIAWFLGAWLNGGCYVNSQVALRIPFHHMYKSNARAMLVGFAHICGLQCEDWYVGTGLMCQGVILSTVDKLHDNLLVQLLSAWGFIQQGVISCEVDRFYTSCLQQSEAFRKALVQGFCDVSIQTVCDGHCSSTRPSDTVLSSNALPTSTPPTATHTHKDMTKMNFLPPYQHTVAVDCGIYVCLTMRSLGYKAVLQGDKTNETLPIIICHVDVQGFVSENLPRDRQELTNGFKKTLSSSIPRTQNNNSHSSNECDPLLPADMLVSSTTECHEVEEVVNPTRCHGYQFSITQLEGLHDFYGLVLEQHKSEDHKHRFLLAHLQLSHNCGHIHCDALIQRAEDGMQSRTTGPRHWITKQPLNGAARHGGLQFSEQEAGALLSSGASFSLHQFRTQSSDYHREHICSVCKQYGQMNVSDNSGMCKRCGSGEHIVQWPTNRAFIKHDRDVRSLGLWPSFEVQTIRRLS